MANKKLVKELNQKLANQVLFEIQQDELDEILGADGSGVVKTLTKDCHMNSIFITKWMKCCS